MSNEDDRSGWQGRLVATVASEVQRRRKGLGMTVAELSEAVDRAGLPMAPAVLYKLEQGKRPTLSIGELFAIGEALSAPPLLLLFPLGRADVENVEVLPGRSLPPLEALSWAEGAAADADVVDTVTLFRDHADAVAAYERARGQVHRIHERLRAAYAGTGDRTTDPQRLEERMPYFEDRLTKEVEALISARAAIEELGLVVPPAPEGFES